MNARPVSSLVFLLLAPFTLISLASALESLRMANPLSGIVSLAHREPGR